MKYKSQKAAMLWLFFLGLFGAHRFYVGKIWTGLLYMSTFGLLGVGVVLDFYAIGANGFKDKKGNELRRDCPKALTFIIGCYFLTLVFMVMRGMIGSVSTIEINDVYSTEKSIVANIEDSSKQYKIDTGDVFWVDSKQGGTYNIEINGRKMIIDSSRHIVELDRAIKIEEYVEDMTLMNKDITEVEVQGQNCTIGYCNELGYILDESVKLHNELINDSLGKEVNIVSKLDNNKGKTKWYIIKLKDDKYSYISVEDVTTNKEEINKIIEESTKEDTEDKAEKLDSKRTYDIEVKDEVVYMSANTIVDMYKNDRELLDTYSGKNVCITGKVKNYTLGEIRELGDKKYKVKPTIRLDNDKMSSWFGISVDFEDLGFNAFLGRNDLNEKTTLRVCGVAYSGNTFGIKECNSVVLIDDNGKEIDSWSISDEWTMDKKNKQE